LVDVVPEELGAVAIVVGLLVPLTAIFVVDAGEVVVGLLVPLTAMLVVVVGAVAVVALGLVVVGVTVLVVGLVVPLAAVPDPLTVDALTVVDPDAFTLPEPLFVASTVVAPDALVVVVVGVALPFALMLFSSTGSAVPLAAIPELLTVDALTVVDPAAFTSPEPLLVAFTVVEPEALVSVLCASVGVLSARPSSAVLTAAAIVLLGCRIFTILYLLSVWAARTGPRELAWSGISSRFWTRASISVPRTASCPTLQALYHRKKIAVESSNSLNSAVRPRALRCSMATHIFGKTLTNCFATRHAVAVLQQSTRQRRAQCDARLLQISVLPHPSLCRAPENRCGGENELRHKNPFTSSVLARDSCLRVGSSAFSSAGRIPAFAAALWRANGKIPGKGLNNAACTIG
jgi:hypothetical protein